MMLSKQGQDYGATQGKIHMDITTRVRMNSQTLQEKFPDIYKEFFAKCSTVVSAPGSFFWSAGLGVIYGGAGILQKLPLRVYVGIEHDHHKTLRYGAYTTFVPHQQLFEDFYHDKAWEHKFLHVINELRKDLPQLVSGKLHILSEVPRGAGLNQSGACNMAITTLLGIESGFLNPEKLRELVTMNTPDIQRDPIFNKIFRFAWKLECCSHDEIGSGSAPFTSFIESASPILFFSERRQGSHAHHPYTRFPSDVEGHYEIFDSIEYSGYRLKDLFGWRGDLSWPIDYGLVYLGQQKHSSVYLKPMRIVKEGLDKLESFLDHKLNHFPSMPNGILPPFVAMSQTHQQQGFWEKSIDFLIILSSKALVDLQTLIENGTTESLDELCDTVQLQEKIYEFFTKGLPSSGERDTLSRIKQVLREKNSNGLRSIRVLPDRPDGGGDLLFIAPQGYLQDSLENFLTLLRTHVNPLVRFDYLSWVDGEESGGIQIDQNLSTGNYSPFITNGTFSMLEWRKEDKSMRRIYSHEALAKERRNFDLLLDEIEQKIFIHGICLTSKEIKSAKATIEILKSILEHAGHNVVASSLPQSNYVERNEMQSKIITPLAVTFKEITGRKLPIALHGGLRKNFIITLNISELTVGILEKQL